MRIILLILLVCMPLAVGAQQASDTPRAGEGIAAFLQRNGCGGRANYREFLKINKKLLRGKEELRLGVKYRLPGRGAAGAKDAAATKGGACRNEVREPLFGKELSRVEVTGNRLKGACFYLVSGHGGPDPGAIGKVGRKELHEDEYAYDVMLRLARNLMQEGAEVRIVIQDKKDGIRNGQYLKNSKRETCMGSAIPLNQVARLRQRCEKINALYAKDRRHYRYCRAIFLHVDSRSRRTQTDVFFYHAPQSENGRKLASVMKRTFESKYDKHQPNRGFEGTVSGRNLYVLRTATPVALFVELGNIQNSFDQRRFVLSSNRQALAKWMMEGFIADYKSGR